MHRSGAGINQPAQYHSPLSSHDGLTHAVVARTTLLVRTPRQPQGFVQATPSAVFAANFRNARLAAGLTQAQVGKLTDLTSNYVSRVEGGTVNLTLATMEKMARAVNVPLSVLLTP